MKTQLTTSLVLAMAIAACGKQEKDEGSGQAPEDGAAQTTGTVAQTGAAPVAQTGATSAAGAADDQAADAAAEESPKNPTDITSNLKRARVAMETGLPKMPTPALGLALTSAPLSDIWTTPGLVRRPRSGTGSVLQFMGDVLSTEEGNGDASVLAAFNNDMFIFCMVTQYLTDTDETGQAADGTYEVYYDTGSKLVKDNCSGNKDEDHAGGIRVTVSTTADRTVFDKRYEFEGAPNEVLYILAKTAEDGTFNLAGVERKGNTYASRSMIQIDASGKLRYESVGHSFGHEEFSGYGLQRIYMDLESKDTYLLASEGSADGSAFVNYTIAAAVQHVDGNMPLSLTFRGQPGGDARSDHDGCVDGATGLIVEDLRTSCGGVTIQSISSATVIEESRLAHASAIDYDLGESSVLPFGSVTEMYTEVWQ
jgi:hypothetical protein